MADVDPRQAELAALLAQKPRQPNGLPDLSSVPFWGHRGFEDVAKEFGPGLALDAATAAAGPLGKVIGAAGQGFMHLPKAVRGLAALLAGGTMSSSEAQNTNKPQDYEPRSLWQEILAALPSGKEDDQRPLTRDEFMQQRRKLQPKTQAEYTEKEVDKVRGSERYQGAGQTLRKNLENEARANAEKLYAGYKQSVTDEANALQGEYTQYRSGWDDQRKEHLSKQFVERHPKTGLALTVGGPVVSALATRGIFGKVNKMGAEIAATGKTARAADDARGLADSIVKADKYATYAPTVKAATAIEAAAIPAELRMTADIIDKKSLPPDAPAREAAEQRMSDIPKYGMGMGYDVLSGLIGTGTGSLWAKARTPSPGVDLHALRNHAAGIPRGGFPEILRGTPMSQDELAVGLWLTGLEQPAALRQCPEHQAPLRHMDPRPCHKLAQFPLRQPAQLLQCPIPPTPNGLAWQTV